MTNRLVRTIAALCVMAALFVALSERVRSADQHRLVVYSPGTTYTIDLLDRKGKDYVGLVELLEPLGKVDARVDGKNWILTFSTAGRGIEAKFRDGKKDVDLPGGKINLGDNFVLQNSRGYVPLASLQDLAPRLTGQQTSLHAITRHLYLGGVGTRFSVDLRKNPTRLVLNFTAPVSPAIAAEGNAVRLTFTRDPVVSSGNDAQDFHDALITTGTFAETLTGAEYIVRGTAPLVANLSDGGRTITIAAPQQPKPAPTPQAPAPAPQTPTTPPAATPKQAPAPATNGTSAARPAFLVVIDAAHGGEDLGATITPKIIEKDITLQFARRIAHELQNRGIQVTLLRNTDTAIPFEQRANTVNTSHAAVYVAVHASSIGHGLRLFTALMPPTPVPEGRHAFIPWDSAQSAHLDASGNLSGSIAYECNKKQISVIALKAAVPPLNNIAAAAVAIEVAPRENGFDSLTANDYQQNIAVAVANGIAALHPPEQEKKK